MAVSCTQSKLATLTHIQVRNLSLMACFGLGLVKKAED